MEELLADNAWQLLVPLSNPSRHTAVAFGVYLRINSQSLRCSIDACGYSMFELDLDESLAHYTGDFDHTAICHLATHCYL